ncbi:phosphoribosylglycinamide formyltransferase [Rehaibacterium terrae]|uniref:phosphoribosylglycinamide formyltransferase n=1 Tax=Rehaibacterium terrae TaxID=1341696 RepID=UPI00391A131F
MSDSLHPASRPCRIAVLASGRGSNLAALVAARAAGRLPVEFAGVFSDRAGAGALDIARAHGIPALALSPKEFADRAAFDESLFSRIAAVQPDLIVCAGYMRLISEAAVRRFAGRMINIHPSLLPKYPGLHTHARAIAAGEREHGASVHYVIPALDAGPVIAQATVPVLAGDTPETLARRVLEREHPLLVASVRLLAEGRVRQAGAAVELDSRPLPAPLLPGPNQEPHLPCVSSTA